MKFEINTKGLTAISEIAIATFRIYLKVCCNLKKNEYSKDQQKK